MISGLLCSRVIGWIASLWDCYRECQIAADYRHLGRRKTHFVFVPLVLLHSGPWLLGLVPFWSLGALYEPTGWFVAGFVAYLLFIALVLWRFGSSAKLRLVLRAIDNEALVEALPLVVIVDRFL